MSVWWDLASDWFSLSQVLMSHPSVCIYHLLFTRYQEEKSPGVSWEYGVRNIQFNLRYKQGVKLRIKSGLHFGNPARKTGFPGHLLDFLK